VAKKVQGTNLMAQNDGRKPRLNNDYSRKVKTSPKLDIAGLDSSLREALEHLRNRTAPPVQRKDSIEESYQFVLTER